MSHALTALRKLLRIAGRSDGSVTVETLIAVPLLAWALAAMVVFFDGFHTRTQTQTAAEVVADLLSRKADDQPVTTAYLEGLNDVFDFLADSRLPTRLRFSSVIWDSAARRHRLQWSYGTRGLAPLPEETFADLARGDYQTLVARFGTGEGFSFTSAAAQAPVEWLAERIPQTLPGEALILVESFALWSPFADVGVGRMRFNQIVVTRPRFTPFFNLEGAIEVYPENNYEVVFAGYTPTDPAPGDPPQPQPPAPDNVVVTQSFDTGAAAGWSAQTITATSRPGTMSFLGPFGRETWERPITRQVDLGSADRASARIAFDLLIIDSWDGYDRRWAASTGEIFQILIDGTPISSDAFTQESRGFYANDRTATVNHEGAVYTVTMTRLAHGSNFTGSSRYNDQIWRVTVDIRAPRRRFTLGLRSRLSAGIDDESWGIDNLVITHAGGSRVPADFVADPSRAIGPDPHTGFLHYSGCPDHRIAANWLTLRHSDLSEPLRFERMVGGSQKLENCPIGDGDGHIPAQPAFVLNYVADNAGSSEPNLRIRLDDRSDGRRCDSTLFLRDPDGRYWFNNDLRGFGRNAGLNLGRAPSGLYHVFLGRKDRGTCRTDVILERH